MRNLKQSIVIIICVIFSTLSCTKRDELFLIAGSGWNHIAKVDRKGKIHWKHKLNKGEECNQAVELPNGNILYSHKTGAKTIDLDHNVIWEYRTPKGTEIQSASFTKEGTYMLAQCGTPSRIMEFRTDGKKVVDITFDTGIKRPHAQMRQITKTLEGTYLVTLFATKSVREYDNSGKLIKEVKVFGNPFSVKILNNSNWLVACGDSHRLIEINSKTTDIVWEIKQNDIEGVKLHFVAETNILSNGNKMICNWQGHAKGANPTPKLIEVDENREIVWQLPANVNIGRISSFDLCK